MYSEVNLVRAVGKVSPVIKMTVEERNWRIDIAPISPLVKAFVLVTIM